MGLFYLLSFIIWPLGSLISSFLKYSAKWTKNIVWAFVVFYGYTFVLSNDTMDANRLLSRFEIAIQYKGNLQAYFFQLFVFDNDNVNFIEPFIHYIVALFTDNFQILMAVLGMIYGFFYSRNICYLIDHKSLPRIKLYNHLILFVFVFIIGYWQINMFRFWTSAHIFFYAIIPFLVENKKNRLWWLIIACLLHYSFILPTIFLIGYLFIDNRTRLYFFIFLASFLVSAINLEIIGGLITKFLPSVFEQKLESKLSNTRAIEEAEKIKGMAGRIRYLLFFSINLIYVVLYLFHRHKLKNTSWLWNLFSFTLLMMMVGNFSSLIPGGGERFLTVSALFSLSFLFFYIQNVKLKQHLRLILTITAPLFFLGTLGYIRYAVDTTNIIVLLGNPLLLLFLDSQKALIHYLPFL